MKIQATCPTCQVAIAVAAEHAGKRVRCPKCSGAISIPGAAASQSPPGPPGKSKPQASPLGTSQPSSASASNSPRRDQPEAPPGKARRTNEVPGERPPEKGKSAPQRRRQEPTGDDVWNQPLSSYSSPAIEEEHFDAFGIAPKSGHGQGERHSNAGQRKGGTSNMSSSPSLKIPLIMAAIGIGSAFLFAAIGLAFPPALIGLAIGGLVSAVLAIWGSIKFLMNAFEVAPMTGFLCFFCSPYALYFLVSRWDINKNAFLIYLLGCLVGGISFVIVLVSGGLVSVSP